jgi:predicted small metal-binding protein
MRINMYTLDCKDLGMNCDYHIEEITVEEVLIVANAHVQQVHMDEFSKMSAEQRAEMEKLVASKIKPRGKELYPRDEYRSEDEKAGEQVERILYEGENPETPTTKSLYPRDEYRTEDERSDEEVEKTLYQDEKKD